VKRTLLIALAALAVACGGPQAPAGGAAVVNGDVVTTARYDLLVSSAKLRIERSGVQQVDWESSRGRTQLREIQAQALRLAVRDAVIEQLARRSGVSVGDADLDRALSALEGVSGGAQQLDQRLEQEGLTRAQYRTLLGDTLLDRELRAGDAQFDQHLADALRRAGVRAYVGPCASDHEYPRCVDGR
jgi:parvulin-like peptidyl-prolyl isomerase